MNTQIQEGTARKIDYRKFLTTLSSFYSVVVVARFKDIVLGIGQQTARKCNELNKDMEEVNNLRAAYQRYRELSAQVESKERSIKIGIALMVNAPVKDRPAGDTYVTAQDYAFKMFGNADLVVDEADIDLSKISLWRIIREIVRQTVEVRVFELEGHLKGFGVKASRPAIESALATHPK